MKKSFLMLAITALTLTMFSCKKDDKPKIEEPTIEENFDGTWTLKKIDFLTEDAEWNEEIEYNGQNVHGYAPFMFLPLSGFQFLEKDIEIVNPEDSSTVVLGKKFNFVNNHTDTPEEIKTYHPHKPEDDYWFWNYTEDGKGFTIGSKINGIPSKAFELRDVSDVEFSEKSVRFKAISPSRVPGLTMNDTQDLPVEITLERGEPGKDLAVYIMGEKFERMY